MIVDRLRINHLKNPMGFQLNQITASYRVTQSNGCQQSKGRIIVAKDELFQNIVYDTDCTTEVSQFGTVLPIVQEPSTRYYWKVQVWDNLNDYGESEVNWFETGLLAKGMECISISPVMEPGVLPVLEKNFFLDEIPVDARLYICGLGVFEAFLNGERIGEEELTPYLTAYHSFIQYITFDVTKLLRQGENRLEVYLADGWYKGKYGYRLNENYASGKKYELMAQLNLTSENGNIRKICTDLTWRARKSNILMSDIYDGETSDDTFEDTTSFPVEKGNLDGRLVRARLSLPVKVMQRLHPIAVIRTPIGETVIDMGQNMTGRLCFICRGQKGDQYVFEHGEVLQDGCFYHDNYRTAKATYTYVSDGNVKAVHPRLTFFGFRYIKVTCKEEIQLEDIWGEVMYSELENSGELTTGNSLVNGLISSILWSQRGNFLDIPTDCPQRDERLGWSGDAQIFAPTACLNMECYSFYRKYLNDLHIEQTRIGGMVPQVIPNMDRSNKTSAAWGDAAIIIPWTLYRIYGNPSILEEQFSSMCAWIDYIDRENQKYGTDPMLWQNGFHYGDWLAHDGGYYHMPVGGTDTFYISSSYFYYSVRLLAQSADVLARKDKSREYHIKAEHIRKAIRREYFTPSGNLTMDTQTGYLIALAFGLYESTEEKEKLAKKLAVRLRKDDYKLKTGFVGTPLLLPVLSMTGYDELAYRILLDTSCPGWLYPITMGATTMWERWDSILPDGHISDTGMNSLNHYANGSVMEWLYGYMAGIRQKEESVGFREVTICPSIHPLLGHVEAKLNTACGLYIVTWKIEGNRLYMDCEIPFNAKADIILPFAKGEVTVNGLLQKETEFVLNCGQYHMEYDLDSKYIPRYSMEDSVKELIRSPQIKQFLYSHIPMLEKIDGAEIQHMTLLEMSKLPFFLGIGTNLGIDENILTEVDKFICEIPKEIF